jgi:hypothetical protein
MMLTMLALDVIDHGSADEDSERAARSSGFRATVSRFRGEQRRSSCAA